MAQHLVGLYVVGVKPDLTGIDYCGHVKDLDNSITPYLQLRNVMFMELNTVSGVPMNIYALKPITEHVVVFKTGEEMVAWIQNFKKALAKKA